MEDLNERIAVSSWILGLDSLLLLLLFLLVHLSLHLLRSKGLDLTNPRRRSLSSRRSGLTERIGSRVAGMRHRPEPVWPGYGTNGWKGTRCFPVESDGWRTRSWSRRRVKCNLQWTPLACFLPLPTTRQTKTMRENGEGRPGKKLSVGMNTQSLQGLVQEYWILNQPRSQGGYLFSLRTDDQTMDSRGDRRAR